MPSPLRHITSFHLMACLFVAVFCCSFLRIHLRVQTTLIGYDIGKLKDYEATLLKKKSLLTMELSKMTSRHHLEDVISRPTDAQMRRKTLAVK